MNADRGKEVYPGKIDRPLDCGIFDRYVAAEKENFTRKRLAFHPIYAVTK